MTELSVLGESARTHLRLEASRKDPSLRRMLGHSQLLDTLRYELIISQQFYCEECAQEAGTDVDTGEVEEFFEDQPDCDPSAAEDADSDSDSDSPTDSESDSDVESVVAPEKWRYHESADGHEFYTLEHLENVESEEDSEKRSLGTFLVRTVVRKSAVVLVEVREVSSKWLHGRLKRLVSSEHI